MRLFDKGTDMGSHDDDIIAPEQVPEMFPKLLPHGFYTVPWIYFLGTKRLRKRCLSTVPRADFYDVFCGIKWKTFLPLKGKSRLPLDMVLTTGRNYKQLYL